MSQPEVPADKARDADPEENTPFPEDPHGLFTGPPGPLLRLLKTEKVAFLIVGGANTVFSTLLFIALDLLYGRYVPSFVVLGSAWLISLIAVFFVYRRLVFRVTGHVLRDLARFALVNLTALLVNMVLLFVASDLLGAPRIPAQIIITCLTVFINYFGHKYFSFRRKPAEVPGPAADPAAGKKEDDS
ncbi:GtrA family protein [Arthrobacter sp. BL-252-APC-1A]|uniref:GtrA family protein n=1 Tax=Arthrobacter sp. BL-252-APC-1A TaxID=2606622 RepID=UPI0012B18D56|nr:GtrA family protein [Arthrobacter sp. BL-252-APC-1A]MSR99229.1 GtrA family protein [Arthrobacter sp. BL-252-APC-1A]